MNYKHAIVAASLLLAAACGSSETETDAPAASDAASPAAESPPAADGAEAEGVQAVSFKVANSTEHTLTHLYISPAASNTWNRDILGDQTAPAGSTITVTIDDGVESCMYDFRAQFDNEQHLDVRGINVCELEGQTVTVSEDA